MTFLSIPLWQEPSALCLVSLLACSSRWAAAPLPPTMVGFLSRLPTNVPADHSSSLQGWPISAGSWSKERSSEFSPVLQTQFVVGCFFVFHSNVFLSPSQERELLLADQQQLAKQTAVMTSIECCVQPL